MSDYLEYTTDEFINRLKRGNEEILKTIEYIKKANALSGAKTTPSASQNLLQGLAANYQQQQTAIQGVQKSLVSLAEAKQKVTTLSKQEKVDNSFLLQQSRLQSKAISEVAGAYQNLAAKEAIAARAVQDLIARGKSATQTQRQYNTELKKAQSEFDVLRGKILAADNATGRWQRTSKRTIEGANQLAGALGVSLGIAGGVALGKAIFDTTKELEGLDLAIRQVIGSQEEAAKTQENLARIAEAYGVDVNILTRSYIGFFASAKNAIEEGKITAQEIDGIFESVAKASGALGLTVDQQQGAFLAIQQMISKGNIQAEELRGQLAERLPGAFGILAKSMGVTEIQLNKMLKDGKVLAAEVLPAFAKELEKAYGVENLQRVESLNASVARLSNSWTDFVAALNDGDGIFSSTLATLVNKLAEAVKGASEILRSEESRRAEVLTSIRKKSYESELEYLKSSEEIDEAYIAARKIRHLASIAELQAQVQANKEANDEIRRQANSGQYVQGGAQSLKENQAAIKALNDQIKSYYGRVAAADSILNKQNKTLAKNTELTKEQLRAIEDANKERYQTRLAEAQLELQVIDQTLDSEDEYYTTRILALELHRKKRIEILGIQYDEEVRIAGKSQEKQKQALIKYHSETLKLIVDNNKKKEELENLYLKSADVTKPEKTTEELLNQDDNKAIDLFTNKKGTRSIEDNFEKQQEAINKTKESIKELEKALKDYLGTFEEEFFGNSGLPTLFDILDKKILGFGGDFKTTFVALAEVTQEFFNMFAQASAARFESEKQGNERSYEIAKQLAGDSTAAKEEADLQYEKKRRQIEARELKDKKNIAKVNIALDAAQAAVAAFKDGNIIKGVITAAAIAAIAAIQISVINSQSVPQYYKGTDNAPGGLAWTNERGAEIHTDKHGNIKDFGTKKGARLTMTEKGDKIFTAEKSKELMFNRELNGLLSDRGISNTPIVNINSLTADQYMAGVARTEAAIANFAPIHISEDRRGRIISQGNQSQRSQSMNNRLYIKGQINP